MKKANYRGQCDLFAVYSPEMDKVYLVPVNDVPKIQGRLRLKPTKNNQVKRALWASKYELPTKLKRSVV